MHKKCHRTLKADTHEGFCSRSMLQDDFARVSTHEGALFAPGACSQVFNRLNIVEYFAEWKFCSRGWSIPMKSLVHTEELCSRSVPLEHAPGAKPSYVSAFTVDNLRNLCEIHGRKNVNEPRHFLLWFQIKKKISPGYLLYHAYSNFQLLLMLLCSFNIQKR